MRISSAIDLGRSLRQVFGDRPESSGQVEMDRARQVATTNAIFDRFFAGSESRHREQVILADEVGLGKTYVALAVAVSILDAIRLGEAPKGLPANKPAVLVLTPSNDALFNKWMREAEAFKSDCERRKDALEWLEIRCPMKGSTKSGNILNLTHALRDATRARPILLVAKLSAFGAALHDRDQWRRRALAVVFKEFSVGTDERARWCRRVIESGSQANAGELLDLRKSECLWQDTHDFSPDLRCAYEKATRDDKVSTRIRRAVEKQKGPAFADAIDDLTRVALARDWPALPLVIIDDVHGLKKEHVQARRHIAQCLDGRVCRLLGLSATPFQLRHDELVSILGLRSLLALTPQRASLLDSAVERLSAGMKAARTSGDSFRRRWMALRGGDHAGIQTSWDGISSLPSGAAYRAARELRPPRIAHAIEAALDLQQRNRELQQHLQPFVIRHQHLRGYRAHFVGRRAEVGSGPGRPNFSWAPGMEVRGDAELAHYLMMRAVTLAKEEKGLPGLGAELTGSYRHLVQTSAVWQRLARAQNPLLRDYREILEKMIVGDDADRQHRKIQATVRRAMEFFQQGQKTLIFCVYTKTAEAVRDELQRAIDAHLREARSRVFGDESSFENFRRRFFNRREPLYSLIQDQPLLGHLPDETIGIPKELLLGEPDLREIARILIAHEERPNHEKPDRRLLLAAAEHVAFRVWQKLETGRRWISTVFRRAPELEERMGEPPWLTARHPLSKAKHDADDPLAVESIEDDSSARWQRVLPSSGVERWVQRLRQDAIGEVIAPYVASALRAAPHPRLPLLAQHHSALLAQLDDETRPIAGQTFRRILMAKEFLLRYLAGVEREPTERWADYLSERYTAPLAGHRESLRDRVHAYLETLVRAHKNQALLRGYHAAAVNKNVLQLVQGSTTNRDHFFLGFNTPYRPEILISTSVGQEGIDLHRECRHVIHHDPCWNPASIEQRTGRVDRIGSKVERERVESPSGDGPALEIAVPYLAATYDERMFEELHRRAQLFEVTLGGDMRVEGRIEPDQIAAERQRREKLGIGAEDEDLGEEGESGPIDLPDSMVRALRIDLSVWSFNSARA